MNKISTCAKTILPLAILTLLCGCHKAEQKTTLESAAKPSGIVSAEKTSFEEVTSKLDKGGNLYVYLSTEQVLTALPEKIASISNMVSSLPTVPGAQQETVAKIFGFANEWVKDSGVEEISGLGMSSIAREPGFYYSKIIVHHYPGQNDGAIWNVLGKEAHPLKELDLLPEDTVAATFSDLDVPLLWTNLQNHLTQLDIPAVTDALQHWPEQFRKMTALDFNTVLASLGGNYGLVVTLDPDKKVSLPLPSGAMEIPSPGLAIVMKVNSDLIFDRVDAIAKNNPLVLRVDRSDLKMRTVTIPVPLPIELRPSLARSGDYLIFATSDSMIENMLAVESGKKKGFKSTAEFARLSQGIPDQGNNFSIVADQFVKSMMQIQQQTLTNSGKMTAAQADALQHAFNNATNYAAYSVGVNSSEGWEGFANGSQSLQSAVLPMVAGIGVVAAVAIPAFIKAHAAGQQTSLSSPPARDPQTAEYNQIIKNLRSLQNAKQKWAKEKGKQKGDAVNLDDLTPYLEDGAFKPAAGETYDPEVVGTQPTAKLAHALHGHRAGSEIIAPPRKKKAAAS